MDQAAAEDDGAGGIKLGQIRTRVGVVDDRIGRSARGQTVQAQVGASGGTRQSVNAALRGFERRGWIEVHDRTVTVRQAAALGRFAGTKMSAS